ncbi:Calcium permeable stress-gated cation channel 1 [Golovinomyces cichoracearum]|uniref:Calcium permeable stress-gated cation channel 1 n=1 Tax=Golovinomyces cichoracearum TaxID=62708 RepID=A0A420J548_9PEZI|nr:Calcium permeable stress-gated cation channel 1 [Golovinomyces cichoracearum]
MIMTRKFYINECEHYDPFDPHTGQEQIYVQLTLSLALGLSALFGFCFLRPRWKSLYAARKRNCVHASALPELPDTFFGWIPALHSVTEEQILGAAGLDAYVFLAFFKMSIKLFGTIFLIAVLVLAPINNHFDWLPTFGNPTDNREISDLVSLQSTGIQNETVSTLISAAGNNKNRSGPDPTYLWVYLIFTYIFTGLAIFFMISQTKSIIEIRQKYLGRQSTVTDRTFKLSGVPPELRSETKLKKLVESLCIGEVESVNLVRNWKKLDRLMDQRNSILRSLEELWTMYQKKLKLRSVPNNEDRFVNRQYSIQDPQGERDTLLDQDHNDFAVDDLRPKTKVYHGIFWHRSRNVDAISYYEEKLRSLDEKILTARKKEYPSTPMAFITMDSTSASQIAVQALLAPLPTYLFANLAPAPSDIVWHNTYLPRHIRMMKAWAITAFIVILTIFWVVPVAAVAGLLDLCYIRSILPSLAEILSSHEILKSLTQTGLPTLVVSLLNIAVPFVYDLLSNYQGMISQGDVELSLISKNFFFTFFNVFLTFTVAGTATKFWSTLQDSLKDTTFLAFKLAGSVQQLAVFYTNFILLQGIGLTPFRLLEFGSVCLYPILLLRSKSPRDDWELNKPPVFKYGFFLPSAILVYILCIVYSILPAGYMVLFFGVIYFINSYYTYKYQLLYAMDHPQHATGGAWPMICYRILLGLGVFQIVMAGIIALKNQIYAAGLVVPLIPFTIWYSYYFARTYHPLMKFIALGSIRGKECIDLGNSGEGNEIYNSIDDRHGGFKTIDEDREEGLLFVNPNFTMPLKQPWIEDSSGLSREPNGFDSGDFPVSNSIQENNFSSSLSLGVTYD